MGDPFRLLAVLAHPDDESLGLGSTLAAYAARGVETFLVTATRGEQGRFHGVSNGMPPHPGPEGLAKVRERELRAAAATLGVREVNFLDYQDRLVDRADPREAIARLVAHVRRIRPQVVVTFPPDGAYGHPDHIAVSQMATAAIVAAADSTFATASDNDAMPYAVSKLYYVAWVESTWAIYQKAFRRMISTVDGVERQAVPWPDWAVTTIVDTGDFWRVAWRAIACHESQVANYDGLKNLAPEQQETLWRTQAFYRAFSLVNGGRRRETDLFEGIETDAYP